MWESVGFQAGIRIFRESLLFTLQVPRLFISEILQRGRINKIRTVIVFEKLGSLIYRFLCQNGSKVGMFWFFNLDIFSLVVIYFFFRRVPMQFLTSNVLWKYITLKKNISSFKLFRNLSINFKKKFPRC